MSETTEVYEVAADDNYHTDTAHLTKTMLATFMASPRDYYEQFVTCRMPRKETKKHMLIGQVCHAVLLEGKAFNDAVRVYPEDCLTKSGAINRTRCDAFEAMCPGGSIYVKPGEEVELLGCVDAIRRHPLGHLIEQAETREKVYESEYNGRAIKCRPDFYGYGVCYDLKFTADITADSIARSFKRFKYWMQDAHYSRCTGAEGFRFWIVETKYPFRIKDRDFDRVSRERMDEAWRVQMDRFIERERMDWWDDDDMHETLTILPYELEANEEGELVDIGEEPE